MAVLKHKGGSLQTWNADGTKAKAIHYGEGLDKPCKDCAAEPHERCITTSGKLLGKNHKGRG